MTRQRAFKDRVRDRMKKTGERYTAARYQLLRHQAAKDRDAEFDSETESHLGLLPGYKQFGGQQGDTAVVHNVLAFSGILNPLTSEPYSEVMLFGLCGGLGFMYAVFEYKGWPPILTVTLRSRTMPDTFIAPVFERVGVRAEIRESSGAKTAARFLDEALAAGKAPICLVDQCGLRYYGMPEQSTGMSPHHVAVVGADDDQLWLDDRSLRPAQVSRETFAKARAGYRKARNRLIAIDGPLPEHDPVASLRSALSDTVKALLDGDVGVPPSFRVNCGLRGMEKFRGLLTDGKDKKGWPTVFGATDRAYAGLWRLYECTHYEYTAPAGGRLAYAEFLDQAAPFLGIDLTETAELFRRSARLWLTLGEKIAGCGDDAVERACAIADRRAELLDTRGPTVVDEMAALWRERADLSGQCRLTAADALALFAELAGVVSEILALETRAAESLAARL